MGEKFDPSGVRTRDRLVRRQPLYNRYSDANHYTIGSLVISSLDLLVTQVKLFLETTGRQVSSVNVHFDRLADMPQFGTHYSSVLYEDVASIRPRHSGSK